MLPPGVQNIIHADGVPQLRFDQDDIQESKARIPNDYVDWPSKQLRSNH